MLDRDEDRKPAYWRSKIEMFARAFDAYVSDKLEEKAANNTYLHGLNKDGRTVPMGQERKDINAQFEALVQTIETKDADDGNVAMFSRAEPVGPFYSALARSIETMSAKVMAGDGWRMQITGLVNKGTVKADEVEWSGINEFLKLQDGKVTKDQVLDYLDGNGVKIEETVLGKEPVAPESELTPEDIGVQENEYDWTISTPSGTTSGVGRYTVTTEQEAREYGARYFNSHIRERNREQAQRGDGTKYGQYQLPGGENYRELLLTLPDQRTTQRKKLGAINDQYDMVLAGRSISELSDAERAVINRLTKEHDSIADTPRQDDYKSSHWDQSGVLAHVRFNERLDAENKKVLFIEELQSDWAAQGRKEGFNDITPALQAEYNKLTERFRGDRTDAENARVRELEGLGANSPKQRIPAAPFVGKTDAWVALSIKRMISYAATNGFDKIAFVNGEQSAERYDLSKQVKAAHALGR